jgi:hypothetical protein
MIEAMDQRRIDGPGGMDNRRRCGKMKVLINYNIFIYMIIIVYIYILLLLYIYVYNYYYLIQARSYYYYYYQGVMDMYEGQDHARQDEGINNCNIFNYKK